MTAVLTGLHGLLWEVCGSLRCRGKYGNDLVYFGQSHRPFQHTLEASHSQITVGPSQGRQTFYDAADRGAVNVGHPCQIKNQVQLLCLYQVFYFPFHSAAVRSGMDTAFHPHHRHAGLQLFSSHFEYQFFEPRKSENRVAVKLHRAQSVTSHLHKGIGESGARSHPTPKKYCYPTRKE
jgi:hypothetical protein